MAVREVQTGGPARRVLVAGLAAALLGGLAALVGLALRGTAAPTLLGLLGAAWPLLCFVGALLVVVSFTLRTRPDAGASRQPSTSYFAKDSTDFVSRMDLPATRPGHGPVHRGQRPPADHWCAQVFEDVEWRRVEAVRALLFARTGLESPVDATGAIDEPALLALILQQSPEAQRALLDAAYEGEYWRPTCARCGLKMVEHPGPVDAPAWACADRPRCSFVLPARTLG